jgi:DNA-binding CsgD family transcriptional regulator
MVGNERYYNLAIQLIKNYIQEMEKKEGPLAEQDQLKIVESVAFTEKLFPKVVVSICPTIHHMAYVSQTCAEILGLSKQSLPASEYIRLILLDDIKGYKSCLEYAISKKIDLRQDYRVIFYYRITNSHGDVIHIEDEKIALPSERGRYVHLRLLKNITFEESFSGTKVKIYKRINGKYILLHEYFPQQEANELTSRQRDIIKLILMGLGNREIANRLSLSVFTIKNHKQTLFKKLGIGSSLELSSLIKGVNTKGISGLFNGELQQMY